MAQKIDSGTTDIEEADKAETRPKLEEWVDMLSDKGLPVFARTVRSVGHIASNPETSAGQLVGAIERDIAMSSRLLKVANSAFFSSYKLSNDASLQRAVLMMGFDAIKRLAMSLAIVEHLLKGAREEEVKRVMARSFHAAAQAKTFAKISGDVDSNEVFLAALMMNIGDLGFWSVAKNESKELAIAMSQPNVSANQAELQVLGFSLKELSSALAKQWNLGELLESALSQSSGENPRINAVLLGHEVASMVEKKGWESDDVKTLLKRVAKTLKTPLKDIQEKAHQTSRDAAKMADSYGARQTTQYIPQAGADPEQASKTTHKADPIAQLKILREMSEHLASTPNLNTLLTMALEGIHKGIGMHRVMFAILTPDRRILLGKFTDGENSDVFAKEFNVDLTLPENIRLSSLIKSGESVNLDPSATRYAKGLSPAIETLSANGSFMAMGIRVGRDPVGLLYADRAGNAKSIDKDSFGSFKQFAQQLSLGFTLVRNR